MRRVDEVMTPAPLVTIDATAAASAVARLMTERGVSHVIDQDVLAGVVCVCDRVTLSDLRRAGVVELVPERCTACGDIDHVRSSGHDGGIGLCLDCKRSSLPPSWDDDIGGG
jgi:hypothetical protein